jgi:hypothetical protein
MMVREITSVFVGPVGLVVVTVTVELEERSPVNPFMLAVICMLPGPVEVTSPEALTVATSLEPVLQVTWSVTSTVVAG